MKILPYLLSLVLLAGCNDSQEIAVNSERLLAAKKNIPVDRVNQFYQSISEKNCQQAIILRPKYTIERCEMLSKVNINTVRLEYNDDSFAVIYLDINFTVGENSQHFNGYLWLKAFNEVWQIQEDFSSVEGIGYEEFLERHIPTSIAKTSTVTPPKMTDDILDESNHPATLLRLRKEHEGQSSSKVILVDVSKQQLSFYDESNKLISQYPISTATKGVGNQAGSDKTPLGSHIISDRFGRNAAYGSVFISRVNTGKIAQVISKPVDSSSDLVTSRILWLDGLELGKNKGGNVDSHKRYIYIHGTQEEGLIGKPASHGCIRMKNNDVIELFQQAPENTLVYIGK